MSKEKNAIKIIKEATAAAKAKPPIFPENKFIQISLLAEEMGEAAQALNNYEEGKFSTLDEYYTEVAQTAAVCSRILENREHL